METKIISGAEWCPHCTTEFDFDVDETVWIANCPCCGRPVMLCDKCHTMYGSYGRACVQGCKECTHCEETAKELNRRLKEWEKEQVGKKVWWDDPDEGFCSGWYTVKSVDDYSWILVKEDGSLVEATDCEIDFDKKGE